MKKSSILYLLLCSLCVSVNPLIAQDDMVQSAEKELTAGNYKYAAELFTKDIESFQGAKADYLKNRAVYDTSNLFVRTAKFPDFKYRSDWASAYYGRGEAELMSGDKQHASADYADAIQIDPTFAQAYYKQAVIKSANGDKEGACIEIGNALRYCDTLREAKDAYINNFCFMTGIAYFTKGKNHIALKEYADGLKDLNMAILISPDSGNYYAWRGVAYENTGKLDLALADYTFAIKRDSNSALAYYSRALLLEEKQDYTSAIKDLNRALLINPAYSDAYLHRAEDCENADMQSSALYDYKQVVKLKPNCGIAWYKLAMHQQKVGDDACDYFAKALQYGIDDAQPYVDECNKKAAKNSLK